MGATWTQKMLSLPDNATTVIKVTVFIISSKGIATTSHTLKLKAPYVILNEISSNAYCKWLLNAWPGHTSECQPVSFNNVAVKIYTLAGWLN